MRKDAIVVMSARRRADNIFLFTQIEGEANIIHRNSLEHNVLNLARRTGNCHEG